eukprot:TRINITY_DN3480_c0_g1_i1.p1 TRINITY_DN3480_c0_g1~~TRINITY_DN3480_c0_g1_i1.p1  ORF type:complete len:582 (+),score=82.61 TRINITY_DN3480_c0_g1_i1:37-1782(+)
MSGWLGVPEEIAREIYKYIITSDAVKLSQTCRFMRDQLQELLLHRRVQHQIASEIRLLHQHFDAKIQIPIHERIQFLEQRSKKLRQLFAEVSNVIEFPVPSIVDSCLRIADIIAARCFESRSLLLKIPSIEIFQYCNLMMKAVSDMKELVQGNCVHLFTVMQETREGNYSSTDDLMVACATALVAMKADISPLETPLLQMLDSKNQNQKNGAMHAFLIFKDHLKQRRHIVDKLFARLEGDPSEIKESALILIGYDYADDIRSTILHLLDLKQNPGFESFNLKELVPIIVALDLLGKDERFTELVITSLVKILDRPRDDNWIKMEIIQSLETLNFYDNRLINAFDRCLRSEESGINSEGVRRAAVHALRSFGVPPNGRQCLEIFWVDKLRRGRSPIFKLNALLVAVSLILLIILFFILLYPEVSSYNRAVSTTATILDRVWDINLGPCQDFTKICYEGHLILQYSVDGDPDPIVGLAWASCANEIHPPGCGCCDQFPFNATIDCYYDPQDVHRMFVSLDHDSSSWHVALFHTCLWPCLVLVFPILSIWPFIWSAWRQSKVERGVTACWGLWNPEGHLLLDGN